MTTLWLSMWINTIIKLLRKTCKMAEINAKDVTYQGQTFGGLKKLTPQLSQLPAWWRPSTNNAH